MKNLVIGALSFCAQLLKQAVQAVAEHVQATHITPQTCRNRKPGKAGKAGDKIARHAKEKRLGIRS